MFAFYLLFYNAFKRKMQPVCNLFKKKEKIPAVFSGIFRAFLFFCGFEQLQSVTFFRLLRLIPLIPHPFFQNGKCLYRLPQLTVEVGDMQRHCKHL